MIYDTIENAEQYFDKNSNLYRAIQYAVQFDLSDPDGVYEVDGWEIFARVMSYDTSPAHERTFENHQLYADIQIMRRGSERQDVVIAEKPEPLGPYNDQKDVTKYKAPAMFSTILLHPGQFIVYYPDDVHRPNCTIGDVSANVRKICMKVRL